MKSFRSKILKELKSDDGFSSKENSRLKASYKNAGTTCQTELDSILNHIAGVSLSNLLSYPNAQKRLIHSIRMSVPVESDLSVISSIYENSLNKKTIDDVFISLCGWSLVTLLSNEPLN